MLREETFLDDELFRKLHIDSSLNLTREGVLIITWEQPSSGELFPSTRDVFNQDMVTFTVKHKSRNSRYDTESLSLTSNLPNLQSLNATFKMIESPSGEGPDEPSQPMYTLANLIINGEDLVAFKADHTDNNHGARNTACRRHNIN